MALPPRLALSLEMETLSIAFSAVKRRTSLESAIGSSDRLVCLHHIQRRAIRHLLVREHRVAIHRAASTAPAIKIQSTL